MRSPRVTGLWETTLGAHLPSLLRTSFFRLVCKPVLIVPCPNIDLGLQAFGSHICVAQGCWLGESLCLGWKEKLVWPARAPWPEG